MNNAQLAAARKAERRFPDVSFRPVDGGVEVNGAFVEITPQMTPEEVFKALAGAANG